MNLLMICYYYPPVSDVGSKRSVAFSKYFKKYGWNPLVLSVRNPDKHYCTVGSEKPPEGVHTEYSYSIVNPYWLSGKMNGALTKLLKLLKVKLTKNIFYEILCFPDHFIGWFPLASIKGFKMIRSNDIDVIYVSCRPKSAAIIGVLLKKLTKKPLVLDFRDPFITGIASYSKSSRTRISCEKWLEKKLLKQADLFFVTAEETRGAYLEAYPEFREKTFTIYNGFDPVPAQKNPEKKFDKFTIIYTGQYYDYGPNHEVYTELFFKALAYLKSINGISSDNFQFIFYGDEHNLIKDLSNKYEISDIVSARSRVPYEEILTSMTRSHLMLLRIVKLMISTKLFEGIPLNIPFLATIPHGEVEEIIRKYSPGSYIVTEEDTSLDVGNAIKDAMSRYRDGRMPNNLVEEFLSKFTRENMTLKLMKIVEENLIQGTRQ
jgi:glycosyltransferase involved in cell wall biosynthesis